MYIVLDWYTGQIMTDNGKIITFDQYEDAIDFGTTEAQMPEVLAVPPEGLTWAETIPNTETEWL